MNHTTIPKVYYESSERSKRRKKNEIKNQLLLLQKNLLNRYGLQFSQIVITPHATTEQNNQDFSVNISYLNQAQFNSESDLSIKKVIYAKDKHNISDRTYVGLLNDLDLNLPSLYVLKAERKKYDAMLYIFENSKGVFIDIKEKLKHLIPKIKKNFANEFEHVIHIKFSADGAQIIKNKLILNFTFTVLNEKEIAKTASGNYTVGMFDINQENYDIMCFVLEDIQKQVDELNIIEIESKTYSLEKYFGGDLKMLAIIYGINAANSDQPCIWCTFSKKKFNNVDVRKVKEEIKKEWSIIDKSKGARSVNIANDVINSKHDGYIHKPIFTSIPFHRAMIDMLHLFLRITDVLYDLFIQTLMELDGLQKTSKDLSTRPHLNSFFNDLINIYNIRAPFFYTEGNKIEIRDLQGPEKKRFFHNFDLTKYAPENSKIADTDRLWKKFWSIYNKIKKKQLTSIEVKQVTKEWLVDFTNLYHTKHITPYIHCFANHIHEFVELYGDINQFNVEGLEKLNHMTHGQVFRATNLNKDYLKQVIRKRNRLEIFCK
jgi:hypothetical protein